jgi:hypothetical protein
LISKGDEPTETPKTEAEVIREELKCFHTRVPFESDVIGIGISIKYHKTRNLAIEEIFSPLDLLSYTAFQEGVREAVYSLNDKQEKEKFSHWMPLCTFTFVTQFTTACFGIDFGFCRH